MSNQLATSLEVQRYNSDAVDVWNKIIDESVNGTFMFRREFMEYHSDRFEDFSYLIRRGKEVVAVFVAGRAYSTVDPNTLIAHPGLTYGGLVYSIQLKYPILEEVYDALLAHVRSEGFTKIIIKPVPRVFCRKSDDASLFYFHQRGFMLRTREFNSVINLAPPMNISKGRRDNIRKARNSGVIVEASENFEAFWPLLIDNLNRTHGVRPPHSVVEIRLLQQKFPENIQLYVAYQDNTIVGGILVFLDMFHGFAHTQYISANEQGKMIGAVDAIIFHILQEVHTNYLRFSFGISTDKGNLNSGLLAQKEGFGATAELMDTYEKLL